MEDLEEDGSEVVEETKFPMKPTSSRMGKAVSLYSTG